MALSLLPHAGDGETHCSKFRSDYGLGRNKLRSRAAIGPCGLPITGAVTSIILTSHRAVLPPPFNPTNQYRPDNPLNPSPLLFQSVIPTLALAPAWC